MSNRIGGHAVANGTILPADSESAPDIAALEAELIEASEEHDKSAAAEKRLREHYRLRYASVSGDKGRAEIAQALIDHHACHERIISLVERIRAAKAGAQ